MQKTIDKQVGKAIRTRRTQLGLSQEAVGILMEMASQQVQKYEKGVNALNSTRLVEMAKALRVPVAYFFKDQPEVEKPGASERESLEMLKGFNSIKSKKQRKLLSDLTRAMGAEDAC